MERKTKIKHSHSTTRRYWATRGRESSCNILLCHLCCPDLYGPLLLLPPTDKLESAAPVMAWAIMRWAVAQLLPSVGSRTHPAQWWIPPVLVSSCDTSSFPDPQWAIFNQSSVNDPLLDSVWRAQEKLCCGWRHKNGETFPPPAMLSLFDGTGMSQPLINTEFSWFPGMAMLFLCCFSMACRQLSAV